MEYAKIPHDKNKSIKLKLNDIEAVHHLFYLEKWSKPQIADRFNVSQSCIDYHLSTDEQKKEKNRRCADANRARIVYDKAYKEHLLRSHTEWVKHNKLEREDFREWRNTMSHEQRDKNNASNWAKEYRIENLELLKKRAKEYNSKPRARELRQISNKKRKANPELYAHDRARNKQYRLDHIEQYKERDRIYKSKPEVKARCNMRYKEHMAIPSIREMRRIKDREYYSRPEVVERNKIKNKERREKLKADPIKYAKVLERDRLHSKIRYRNRKI